MKFVLSVILLLHSLVSQTTSNSIEGVTLTVATKSSVE